MLLGDVCTRGCRFCAVTTGDPRGAVDVREPEHVARAIARLDLQYVVMTMVNRDDLLDGGAEHVGRTVERLHQLRPDILIETLVGDFNGHLSSVDTIVDAGPDVFAHNVECVRRLQRTVRDVRSSYDLSLTVLRRAKERSAAAIATGKKRLTKSSIMVGLGETDAEVTETMRDLRDAGVDVVTIGQYLRPGPKYHEVMRFVTPEQFAIFQQQALEMGFFYAASGPLVRSSYRAAEVFLRSLLADGGDGGDIASIGKADPAWIEAALGERLTIARREAARVTAEIGAPAAAPGLLEMPPPERGLVPASALVRR
jgi:lipoic acid synthetase